MTRKDWNTLVTFVREHDPFGMPTLLYDNYWSWECRATLARVLAARFSMYRQAIQVMETLLTLRDCIDRDQYCWALRDMGVWIWISDKDGPTALRYLREAIAIVEATDTIDLMYSVRGEIWFQYLSVLHELGQVQTARQMVELKLQEMNSTAEYDESYDYYGKLFLAQVEGARKRWDLAIDHLKPVLSRLAKEYPDLQKRMDVVLTENNPQLKYERLIGLTDVQPTFYVPSDGTYRWR